MTDELRNIEHAGEITFKPAFIERYQDLLGDKYEEFIKYSLSYLRKGIRVNTIKIATQDLKQRLEQEWVLTPVPWSPHAFWIKHKGERRDVGNIPEHQLGYFYIQEPASMIPPLVLDPQPGEVVLDMCASPGSKSSQIAMYMENQGVLIANEITASRLAPLQLNLQRCGVKIALITQMDGRHLRGEYDRVLVDAPCSGVGTIRKSLKTIVMWNPKMITRLSRIQYTLLCRARQLLKIGGTIVYSTCTTEPEENEGVVTRFLEAFPDMTIEPIELEINRSPAITEWKGQHYHKDIQHCLRIWPMDNDTEGFFVAKLRKK